jgi:hypothetical protein
MVFQAVEGETSPADVESGLSDVNLTPLRVGEPLGTPASDHSEITGPLGSCSPLSRGEQGTKHRKHRALTAPATSLLVERDGSTQRSDRVANRRLRAAQKVLIL